MKTKFIKFLMIIFALIAVSCEDMLDTEIRSSITGQNFWQSEEDFTPYLYGIYERFRVHMDDMDFGEERSDLWTTGYNAHFTYWSQNITPGITRDWTSFYGTIGHCNLILQQIESFDFTNIELRDQVKAEALALRAAIYFHIAKIYGDVPLVLETIQDENAPLYPRSPVADIFTQINTDISDALSLFPEDDFIDKYRFSKPAVYALLADVKMWSAKVLGGGVNDFNDAISAITQVENSGVTLLEDYGTIFDSKKNEEIILSIYLNRNEYESNQYNYSMLRFDTSEGADNVDELPIRMLGQQAMVLSPEALALFAMYPEDKRISRTYIPELYDGVAVNYWANKFRGTLYSDERIPDSDIIVYRLSDLLLLKAEAYAALNQPADALTYLNKVRERAGIPLYTETDKDLLEKEILDERGRELFHELKRWWDLVRAHQSDVIDIYEFVPNLEGKSTPIYWPVHTNVLSKNDKLVQTEGY